MPHHTDTITVIAMGSLKANLEKRGSGGVIDDLAHCRFPFVMFLLYHGFQKSQPYSAAKDRFQSFPNDHKRQSHRAKNHKNKERQTYKKEADQRKKPKDCGTKVSHSFTIPSWLRKVNQKEYDTMQALERQYQLKIGVHSKQQIE